LDGDSTTAEFSEDGITDWHSTATATDKYMRTRTGTGAWQGPFKIVAEDAGPVPRSLPKVFAQSSAINPNTTTAGIKFTTDGRIQVKAGGSWVNRVNWHNPPTTGAGSTWHVRRALISGTGPSSGGTFAGGTWLPLTSERYIELTQSVDGTTTTNQLFELSADGGSTVYSAGDGVITVSRTTEA
jgi:hypothetical protein